MTEKKVLRWRKPLSCVRVLSSIHARETLYFLPFGSLLLSARLPRLRGWFVLAALRVLPFAVRAAVRTQSDNEGRFTRSIPTIFPDRPKIFNADYESLAPVHSDPQFYHVCCSLLNPYTLNLSGFSISSPHRISIDLEPDRSLAAGSCCDELMADHNLAARQVQRWLQSTCGGRTGAEDALIINRTIRTSSSLNHNSPNRRFRLEALVW